MSIYYDLFLEGMVGGEWRCLSPSFADAGGNYKAAPILSGQSPVGELLSDIGCWHSIPDGVSAQVTKALWKKVGPEGEETDDIDERFVQWFPLSDIRADPARFEHEAYVAREAANAFELKEVEEIWEWLTPEEYGSLPGNEKQAYTYYRWTQPFGTYDLKCRLKTMSSELATMYEEAILMQEEGHPRVGSMRVVVRYG